MDSSRLALLGGHFVLNFGGKNELAVSQNMVRADIFLRVLLRFLSVQLPACAEASAGRRRDFGISRGDFIAACGGENGSHYFKNTGLLSILGGDFQ